MGKQWEQCQTLFWGGSKITADGDYSHEIKRHLLLGRKVMTNLDSIFKSRDITLPTKVCLVKAVVFPVVMYGCETWTVKKAEHRRIDAFELWYWRRLLRVPWTARRSNQSIIKEISPEYSLEGLMLKLKHQYFGHRMMQKNDSLEKTDAGKNWMQEKKGTCITEPLSQETSDKGEKSCFFFQREIEECDYGKQGKWMLNNKTGIYSNP